MLALCAVCVQCSSGSDAPPAQVLLFIDTDAPIASQALADDSKRDASIDTLRIDVLGPDDAPLPRMTRIIPASDERNWPISFGLQPVDDTKLARLRLRVFRARNADAHEDPDTKAQVYDPVSGYTIDRLVEIPLPDKGAAALRVVLRSVCRGKHTDLVRRTTCVNDPMALGTFRDAIEVLPSEVLTDGSAMPPRPESWWPAKRDVCPKGAGDEDRACIPGGFFMLGNMRVVGFGALRRADAVPAHPVVMRPFLISRKEVTVGRYWNLTKSLPDAKEKGCTAQLFDPNQAGTNSELPINCVYWNEAQNACMADRGGRLPTEAEWEYVASGRGRGYLFPWNDDPPTCAAASLGHQKSSAGLPQCDPPLSAPEPVGSHTKDQVIDPAIEGSIWDLAGSVSEWAFDSFKGYDEDKDCWERDTILTHPACYKQSVVEHSIRGGNWSDRMEVAYVALRNNQPDRYIKTGFRCVWPLPDQKDPLLEGSNKEQYDAYLKNTGQGK
jgi:formylglycine-generating enzyme required for sulfatase activity